MSVIYLAEDSKTQQMVFKRALQRLPDAEIREFDDGLEVYFAVYEKPPDVLILDIMLPTLSGAAALRLLKFDRSMAKIPILILSALNEDDIEQRCLDMQADAYLGKPFKPEQLTTAVEFLLSKNR